ncbi:hypothetical protein GCM10023319_73700 [Nocardia iowensis]
MAATELEEEAGVRGVHIDFSRAECLRAGYTPDTRETDNAWMESTVLHYHMNPYEAANIRIQSGRSWQLRKW